jgi:hypothetical protein
MMSSPLAKKPAGLRGKWQFGIRMVGGKYFTCHAGLQYITAPFMDKNEHCGLFLSGQFYWHTPDEREQGERNRRLAARITLTGF